MMGRTRRRGLEQRRRALPTVIVRPALRHAGGHRENRRRAIRRLNLTLLINAQHQDAIGRVEIEPDDVAHFVDKQRVARERERLAPVRLQAKGAPDAPDRAVAQSRLFRQGARAPMCRLPRRRLQRGGINCSTLASVMRRGAPVILSGRTLIQLRRARKSHGNARARRNSGHVQGCRATLV